MNEKRKQINLGGIYTAVVTPMSDDGEKVLPQNIGPFIHFLSSKGIDGILLLGSTGEAVSLTLEEKMQVISETSGTKGGMKTILGCISNSLAEVHKLLAAASEKGFDAVLVPPPYYYKSISNEGIEKYFEDVLKRAELPVLLYNIPSNTGFAIDRKMLDRLSRFETLFGIKDSGGKLQDTAKYLETKPKRVFLGSDLSLLNGLKLGVTGTITALSNVVPELVVAIKKGWSKGKEMTELQERLSEIRRELGKMQYLAAIKQWLGIRGIKIGGVRLPHLPLSPIEYDKILLLASKFRPFID